jgi:hypothetical protein
LEKVVQKESHSCTNAKHNQQNDASTFHRTPDSCA